MKFWLETLEGVREVLPSVSTEEAAMNKAREVYPEDTNPDQWVVAGGLHKDDDEDYVLVPGGPANEEFTWMPRSMWAEGGPLAVLDK
jgi:hypothetical protein